ncbi:uncharacterized protein LOC121381363 [Gigantopelta aegis]|uniref:uncharacterized protein LOC121381363 n=1 Tax=Gigantopelta aegis TaxID=1735272 RepID=UPI001B88D24D|nr:uncharacterized protein LOC121381363 [Gigantopelta aegis]
MHARRELLVFWLLSFVPIILTQGYGQDPTGGENCRVVGCGTNAYCTNDYNNRVTMCRCRVGFEISSTNTSNCVDIYECSHREVCEHGECINTFGGFHCRCFPGYIPAADSTFCLLADWAPQTDPWADFWGFMGPSSKQSEPAFDYNNPWGYNGPLSPNYIDSSYHAPSNYQDQGSKYTIPSRGPSAANNRDMFGASQQNSVQQGRGLDRASQYLPQGQSFVDPMTQGNTNTQGSGFTTKQDPWLTSSFSDTVKTSLMEPHVLDPAVTGSSTGLDPWNTPTNPQGPTQSGKSTSFSTGPTLSTGASGGGLPVNTLDTAASKQWANDPWNTQTNPLDPLGQSQVVDVPQTLLTEGTIDRHMGIDKNTLNSNSITSGAAAVPQSSNFPRDPNSISYQKDAQWLNFGQSSVNSEPAVRTTWEATSPMSRKQSSQTSVSATSQNQVASKNAELMPPPDNLTGHPLLLYLILQNMWQ